MADELPVHYRGGVGKSEKRRLGGKGKTVGPVLGHSEWNAT